MAPKRPPPKKKSKRTDASPETSDEFLAAGVAAEESAEKHRAGDATKSARFYAKALELYADGQSRFPADFDLAYNAARARFALTQYPGLAAASGASIVALLADALAGHELALALRPHEADVLFNTAQVLAALGEERAGAGADGDALEASERAVAYLLLCFEVQEEALAARAQTEREVAAQIAAAEGEGLVAEDARGGESEEQGDDGEPGGEEGEKWASIEEPVTVEAILDTCVAIAEALASACQSATNLGVAHKLPQIEQSATLFLQQKAQKYIEQAELPDRTELCAARAKTKASLLDAAYSLSQIELATYDDGLAAAWQAEAAYVEPNDPAFLCAHAETLQDFANTAAEHGEPATKRWARLEKALELLTVASKQTKDAAELSGIHIARGDVELARLTLSLTPTTPANLQGQAVRNTLVQNALKFYRGAKVCAQGSLTGAAQQNASVAQIKEAIATAVDRASPSPLEKLQATGVQASAIADVVDDMLENLVLPNGLLRSFGIET